MTVDRLKQFATEIFVDRHGATPCTDYGDWHSINGEADQPLAVLAYRRAAEEALFLETYLSAPIEKLVSGAMGRDVGRAAIVEIGCLAGMPTSALLTLWRDAARALARDHEIAVATLTIGLRAMFARIGMPFIEIGQADPAKLAPGQTDQWGSYYASQPIVCAGNIRAGLAALESWQSGVAA